MPRLLESQASRPTIVVAQPRNSAGRPAAKLEQIQLLLGHASVQTTERYLGTKQDLVLAPNEGRKLGVVVCKSSRDNRRGYARPVPQGKLARFPDNIQRRQQFLETPHCARSGSRRHHELRFRARALDHPCDSPATRASAGAIHTERAERVSARREQLEVVG